MPRIANNIVIGGSIGIGKTTLAKGLGFPCVDELDEKDTLQMYLLNKMYQGDEIATGIFQLDLMLSRHDNYRRKMASGELYVFDRSILEDKLFAEMHLKNNLAVLEYYNSFWNGCVKDMIEVVGIPRAYILLRCSWETFEKRIFGRNRKAEIENWEKNKLFFKNLHSMYIPFVEDILKKHKINYTIIDTDNLSIEQVLNKTKEVLNNHGIK